MNKCEYIDKIIKLEKELDRLRELVYLQEIELERRTMIINKLQSEVSTT